MKIENILSLLKIKLNEELPKEKAWLEMSSRFGIEDLYPKHNHYKEASVLICLVFDSEKILVPFIQRPKEKGPHSKQIGLPGGSYDQFKDSQLINTAIRETYEEIGVILEENQIIGKLSSLYIPISNFLVHPFVGFLEKPPNFQVDTKEVEELLLLPLDEFKKPDNKKYQKVKIFDSPPIWIDVPAFCISNKIIWGATAMIMNEFLYIYNQIDIEAI